jgi:PAS domain S-box-containing protein
MKLRTKIVSVFVIFLSIMVIALALMWVPALKDDNREKVEQECEENLDQTILLLENFLQKGIQDVDDMLTYDALYFDEENNFTNYTDALAGGFSFSPNIDEIMMINVLADSLETHDYIDYIYIGRNDGDYISTTPLMGPYAIRNKALRNYDPRQQSWFIKAKESPNEAIITKIKRSDILLAGTDENDPANYYVTIAKAIIDEQDNFLGVIGMDVWFTELLSITNLTKKDYLASTAFMMGETLLQMDKKDRISVLEEQKNAEIKDEKDTFLVQSNFEIVDWSLQYSIDKILISEGLFNIGSPMALGIIGVFVVLISLLLFFLNITILTPLKKLNSLTSEIAQTGDLTRRLEFSGKDEISVMANNFNAMIDQLRDNTENLENIIVERTKELRMSETSYRNLFEQSADSVFIINPKTGMVIDCNEHAFMLFGMKSREEIIGKTMSDFAPELQPDGKRSSDSANKHALKANETGSVSFDFIYQRVNGQDFDAHVSMGIVQYGGKDVFQATLQDVTERKQATREIIAREKDSRNIFESASDGLIILDSKKTTIIDVNSAIIDMFDLPDTSAIIGKMVGYPSNEFQPDGQKSTVFAQNKISEALEKKTPHFEYTHTTLDGRAVICEIRLQNTEYRNKPAIIASLRDITERKAAEEKIRESELRINQTASAANIGLWTIYPKKDVVLVNRVLSAQLGYEQGELCDTDDEWSTIAGGFQTWSDMFHPDDTIRANDNYNAYVKKEIDEYQIEYRLRTKNGSYRWFLSRGKRIGENEADETTNIMGVNILIDQIKQTQHQLELSREEAEKASRVKSEFLANMSHEIRTPMNAVIGLNSLMKNTDLTNKQKDYVAKIDSSAKNLLTIINDILDFSKLESGKLLIEKTAFNLDEVLKDLSTIVSFKAFEKDVEFLINRRPNVPNNLIGDPLRLGQALLNLAGNAIKFTEKGEVMVKVELVDASEKVSLKFSITDTGIGMTDAQLNKLFQAFEQADTSTTRKYGGTGLGLIITRNIIGLMGGEIVVESELGKGTTFSFEISFLEAHKSEIKDRSLSHDIKNINILAVDDGESARTILDGYLAEFENRPVIVSSGKKAIEEFEKQPFDLVLMDWKMPEMDGVQTWTKIQQSSSFSEKTKAVLMTAYSFDEMSEAASEANFNAVLPKPFSQSSLYDAVARAYISNEQASENVVADHIHPDGFDAIRGAKILVVDDNEINQQVAQEMLKIEGFFVSVADNGKIAVDMVKNGDYDIVFMDLQMPVMDGYISSKTIRMKVSKDIPIVALSADAMSGVKDRVADAGMNDYISKPIDRMELFSILVKWISPGDRETVSVQATEQITIDFDFLTKTLKDINTKDGLLRSSDNIKLYIKILTKFKKNYHDFFSELKQTIESNDIDTAKKSAHMLKGVTGNIGADALHANLVTIDEKLKAGNVEGIIELIDDSQIIMKRIATQIGVLLKGVENVAENSKVVKATIDEKMMQQKLVEMLEKLEGYSTSAEDICEELLKYKHNKATIKALDMIITNISDFDFDLATTNCKALMQTNDE